MTTLRILIELIHLNQMFEKLTFPRNHLVLTEFIQNKTQPDIIIKKESIVTSVPKSMTNFTVLFTSSVYSLKV